ncbi:hypothetical protein [Bartonella australis]|uniref:hypothetical protein n=1 Tax=Bartonella australis TaxID=388640 RepID=UPI00059FF294|nr:hypothetical protein [Bartonella australis]
MARYIVARCTPKIRQDTQPAGFEPLKPAEQVFTSKPQAQQAKTTFEFERKGAMTAKQALEKTDQVKAQFKEQQRQETLEKIKAVRARDQEKAQERER